MNRILCVLFLALCLVWFIPLFAIDHLDLYATLEGEFSGCQFGAQMVSIDFNADGHKDLVVLSPGWNPNGTFNDQQRYGKLYFFWGGPAFDSIPDMIIEGEYPTNYNFIHTALINAGDTNGDGIEDIALLAKDSSYHYQIQVLWGSTSPNVILDAACTGLLYIDSMHISALGDVNSDGKSDISITRRKTDNICFTYIWDDIQSDPWIFHFNGYTTGIPFMNGLGDVNGDGMDDFLLQSPYASYENKRYVVYFGGENFPQTDSLVIGENIPNDSSYFSSPIGDYNGDGIDDFVAYNGRLWLGSPDISAAHTLFLRYNTTWHVWETLEHNGGIPLVYGDLNGDGKDDIVGSCNTADGNAGQAGIWVGTNNSHLNGDIDLFLWPPVDYQNRNFGWAKATGDFNADGLCDLAISAPWWGVGNPTLTSGKVFIYSGNTSLQDSAVPVEDDYLPIPQDEDWSLEVYPSPSRTNQFTLSLSGKSYKSAKQLTINVYNIKGQSVLSQAANLEQSWSSELSISLPKTLSKGIYLLSLEKQGKRLVTKRITIL